MPELPEVETIARALRIGGRNGEPIIGQTVERVHLLWTRTLAVPDPPEFTSHLVGQTVQDVRRRGKFLVIDLADHVLLIHLRMSGDIRVEPDSDEPDSMPMCQPHDRMLIQFFPSQLRKLRLAFNDPRKFGRVWLVQHQDEILGSLGPEPLSVQFTADQFFQMLQKQRRQIKPLLLDQSFLAGLGNIYSDEALHLGRIHPLRASNSLTPAEATELWLAIRSVLEEGIRRNGASIDWVYRGGDFQNSFQVYQRTGEPCRRCGSKIERILVGQRSTHFCSTCQKL